MIREVSPAEFVATLAGRAWARGVTRFTDAHGHPSVAKLTATSPVLRRDVDPPLATY